MQITFGWLLGLRLSHALCGADAAAEPPLVRRLGEALRYDVELAGVYVGSWESKVLAPRDARGPTLRAQLHVEPLLAPLWPSMARMLVQLSGAGSAPEAARMQVERAGLRQDVRWAFTDSARRVSVRALKERPGASSGAEAGGYSAADRAAILDPLSAFYALRRAHDKEAACTAIATLSGIWRLSSRRLADEPHKTAAGYQPSRSFALDVRPQEESRAAARKGFTGTLWQAAEGEPVIYEVVLQGEASVRARLSRYEPGVPCP